MERIDDLLVGGLRLIQDDTEFCFGCDAVELANFASGTTRDRAVDLGAGSGIISVLLAGKKGIKTTAVEVNPVLANLAKRNAALNNLDGLMTVLEMPMQQLSNVLESGSQTMVVSNPPYFKAGSGELKSGGAAAARHEILVTLSEVVGVAAYLLGTGGRFFAVYTTDRMAELISLCTANKLEPKQLEILHAKNKNPHLCLLKCIKDGKVGLKVSTREIKDYGME